MWLEWLVDGLLAALLLAAAIILRMKGLGDLRLDFDSVDPFMRAVAWVTDCELFVRGESTLGPAQVAWPATSPWIYQFGPALVWMYAPFVVGAESLQEAFARRYVVQALCVVVTYGSMRWLLYTRQMALAGHGFWPARLGAWTAALAIGFLGEPFGLLGYGDQNYLAPELGVLVSVVVAAVLLRQRYAWLPVGFGAFALAVNMHVLALCYLPGLLLVAFQGWRAGKRRLVAASLVVGLLFSIPEAVHVLIILMEGPEAEALGFYSFHSYSSAWIVNTAAEAFGTLEPKPSGSLLLAAPLFVLMWHVGVHGPRLRGRESKAVIWLAVWSLLTAAGLLAAVLLVGNHRGYHWRIPLPALALVSGLAVFLPARALQERLAGAGAAIRWSIPAIVTLLVAVLSVAMAEARLDRFPPGRGGLTLHRWMADVIQEDAGDTARCYDAVVLGGDMNTYSESFMPAVYVEHRMMGVPRTAMCTGGPLFLAVNGPARLVDDVRLGMGWDVGADSPLLGEYAIDRGYSLLLLRFEDPATARACTAWLHQRFTGEETPRLMLDSNHVLDLTMHQELSEDWLHWFDPGLALEFPGVFSRDREPSPPQNDEAP